jgi:mannosyl-oligosaccharide alpha-1,2-mannosidase
VHEWGTFNQQLRLSWSDHLVACHELFSETVVVPFDRWVHVGFSLSEAENTARLFIDGAVVADTKLRIGSYAKAGQKVSVNEASMLGRTLAQPGVVLGAHLPQPSDAPHVQSHVFFGFLGDVRLVHAAPVSPDDAKAVLMSSSAELLSQKLVPPSSIILQVEFKGFVQDVLNIADGQKFTRDPPMGKPVNVITWSPTPRHPWFVQEQAAVADIPNTPVEPLPTMDPTALQRTWPTEWTKKFDHDTLLASQRRADVWAEDVRKAMVHTWRGYKTKAWGHDDLKPQSGRPKDWCRLGIFILDSLTTLWLMGLTEEFDEAEDWIKANTLPTPGSHGMHSLFEMTIRGFGGLLGAYALSGRQIFLDNARHFGDIMLKSFDTPSGIPKSQIDVGTGATKWHTWVRYALLAEVGTVQVEMRYLSHAVGDDKYKKVGDKAFNTLLKMSGPKGLVPLYLTTQEELPRWGNSKISLGAMGDSYYEYLLKQWIQSGKTEDRLKEKWKDAMREMLDELVKKTDGGLTYICEKDNNQLRHRMDHLACFVAGMLIMGARELPKAEVDPRWETTAAELTYTCHMMYKRSPSGLSPEYVVFHQNAQTPHDMTTPNDAPHNLLRPEAAEAMYYMHYYTGDPMYREWAHEMFDAFQKHAKTKFAYAALKDVRTNPPVQRDDMESFWAAETLKYLYLIQMPRSKLNLDEFVFNTEAHPMRRWVGGK